MSRNKEALIALFVIIIVLLALQGMIGSSAQPNHVRVDPIPTRPTTDITIGRNTA